MRRSVLVVEDDLDFREVLGEHLRAAGFLVAEAGNGAEALTLLADGTDADVVLLDLRMPVMDGAEFCRRLEGAHLDDVPVVLMTAELDTREVERFRCVAHVLRKPFEAHALDAAIGRLLDRLREVLGRTPAG